MGELEWLMQQALRDASRNPATIQALHAAHSQIERTVSYGTWRQELNDIRICSWILHKIDNLDLLIHYQTGTYNDTDALNANLASYALQQLAKAQMKAESDQLLTRIKNWKETFHEMDWNYLDMISKADAAIRFHGAFDWKNSNYVGELCKICEALQGRVGLHKRNFKLETEKELRLVADQYKQAGYAVDQWEKLILEDHTLKSDNSAAIMSVRDTLVTLKAEFERKRTEFRSKEKEKHAKDKQAKEERQRKKKEEREKKLDADAVAAQN